MRRISAWLSVVAIVLLTVGVYAQKPNFSGKWVREAPAGGGGGGGGRGGGGGFGAENTITQTDKTLTIEYMGGGQNPAPMKLVFNLDGSESKNPGGRGGEQVSKATWDGAKIVITTATPNGEIKRVISMEGANMVIESTTPGREGGAPQTSKAVYKKA
jgi:hypothetical protein